MQCRFFSDLSGLTVENLKSAIIVEDFKLSQHPGYVLDNKVFDDFVVKQIGEMKAQNFCNKPYLWGMMEQETPDIRGLNRVINSNLTSYFSFLWFVKDNSVNLLDTYTYVPEISNNNFFARSNAMHFSNCLGDFAEVSYTLEDFAFVGDIFSKIQLLVGMVDSKIPVAPFKEGINIETPRFNQHRYNDTNRITRAISFLQLARTQSFLPIKISFYTAILECLFTTDSQEVSHKVGERTSYYLGDNDKYDTYKNVKLAYGLRSKFFHGQRLENKISDLDKQKELSKTIDDIIRRVLTKIIMVDSKKFLEEDYLEAFLNSLLFASNKPIEEFDAKKEEKGKNKK